MRQVHQNKRMRGRSRKPSNPLGKSYESSGPDVKIRGSAQHVADKYTQLSRDAQSSGDRVMSENYLQHAEHYNRLIAAAQAQMQQQQPSRDDDNRSQPDNPPADRGNGAESVMPADAPQPVVGSAPIPASDANGTTGATGGEADAAKAGGENDQRSDSNGDDRPRRRVRGGRGRAPRRAPEPSPDGAGGEPVEKLADTASEPVEITEPASPPAEEPAKPAQGEDIQDGTTV